ncbi:MAG: hypothetical protein WBE92_02365 [Steroidobacteraceae bacterium]
MTRSTAVLALGLALLGTAVGVSCALDPGRADTAEPAPSTRSAQAKLPDWSGQWEIDGITPNATGGFEQSLEDIVGGAIRQWGQPPYTSDMLPRIERANAFRDRVQQGERKNGPSGLSGSPSCTFGYPFLMLFSPLMFEALTTPKETVLIFSSREVRHVYTDGRPHAAKEDLWPTYWGDSIGHWEGQTLVIDTIAVQSPFVPQDLPVIPIFAFGGEGTDDQDVAILSGQAHFIERIRMIGNQLEDRMTIIDPVMFSVPWHIRRTYRRVANLHRMIYEDCTGEDRNLVVNGRYTLAPPPPPTRLPPELAPLLEAVSRPAPR